MGTAPMGVPLVPVEGVGTQRWLLWGITWGEGPWCGMSMAHAHSWEGRRPGSGAVLCLRGV